MIAGIERVIINERPDWILLYGDTNSTLAGAVAASKLGVRICHVEAGLRSFNRSMPEEINRIITDRVSDLLFAPTKTAVQNLHRENIVEGVFHVGDIMYDASLRFGLIADQSSKIIDQLELSDYYLATIHRQDNTDYKETLSEIIRAFDQIANDECPVVFPVHPRTAKMLEQFNIKSANPSLKLIPPVSFLDMIKLEKNARAILTDSGGIQKEAYFHKTPCITIRNETEWVETVNAGWNQLVGAKYDKILGAITKIKNGEPIDDYGNGDAAEKMISVLKDL
jgi:UDP-N-acetylglucosamine 2-epimerase